MKNSDYISFSQPMGYESRVFSFKALKSVTESRSVREQLTVHTE